jgi:predicted enzyme related to lactoylglutathione lyase
MATTSSEMASVRYLVDDVDRAIDFYTTHLGFTLGLNASPAFAGITFRNGIVKGPGGQQILLLDPAGNPVELFQPANR